jgi:hypothetical protein
VVTGSVPPLAPFFQPRPESGAGLTEGLRPGETILLLPAPAGSGGTGKTQLAVEFTHVMWSTRAVDLVAWIPAATRGGVISGYARAAADLGLLNGIGGLVAGTADAAAERFLDWLSRTRRRWAVVLDDLAAPVDIRELWPHGPAGQVVVTSGLREAELAAAVPEAGRSARAVPGFTRREALSYLQARLTDFPDQRIEAIDLAQDLGGSPLALALAASVITATRLSCRQYRARYAQRAAVLAEGPGDSHAYRAPGGPPLLATWSLAVEQAQQQPPAGLAWPALAFAAALDAGGIPGAVVTAPAACAYIAGPNPAGPAQASTEQADPDQADRVQADRVHAAYAALERLGLVCVDAASAARTVWLHPAIRTAVRTYLAPRSVDAVAAAAAAALVQAWPDAGSARSEPPLSQALRDSAGALREFAGARLWQPDAHPVLLRAGASLAEAPALTGGAAAYWQELGLARSQAATQ